MHLSRPQPELPFYTPPQRLSFKGLISRIQAQGFQTRTHLSLDNYIHYKLHIVGTVNGVKLKGVTSIPIEYGDCNQYYEKFLNLLASFSEKHFTGNC